MKEPDASRIDEVNPPAFERRDGVRRRRRFRRKGPLENFRNQFREASPGWLTALLGLVVIGSLLAVGTVHVAVVLVVASLAFVCAAIALFTEDTWKDAIPAPAWVLAALAGYTLLQSIPLPWPLLHRLSPVSAQTWADARKILGQAVNHAAPLSVDPGATRVEATKWLCYAAVFIAAASLTKRKGAKRGLLLVVLAAVIGGLLTIVHGLLGLDKWLGIYKPSFGSPGWALGPLLNTNNFSGYLNLATFSVIGLAMTGRPPLPRWVFGVIAAVLVALSFLTGSRGGALSLLLGALLVTLALREQAQRARRSGSPSLPGWLPIAGIVLVGGSLFVLGANTAIWDQLLDETTSKIRIVEWTAPLIADHRWFGVGRGAYETASSAYRSTPGLVIYSHAENFIADWLAEWGLPVSVAGLVSLTWLLRPKYLGFLRHPIPTASLVGVIVLLLQNLVDLGLEIASIGIALFTILGALWGGALRDRQRRSVRAEKRAGNQERAEFQSGPMHDIPSRSLHPREQESQKSKARRDVARNSAIRTGAFAVAASLLIGWTTRTSQPDAADERTLMHDEFAAVDWKSPSAIEHIRGQLSRAIERHPADPYLPVLGGLIARSTGQNALAWMNQALRRDPLNARAQLLLADVLASRGNVRQALATLKRCALNEPDISNVIADRAKQFSHSIDDLELAVPDGVAGVPLLNALAMRFTKPEEQDLHQALLQRAFQRQPNSFDTHAIVVDDLLRKFDDPKSDCVNQSKTSCEDELLKHVRAIESQNRKSLMSVLIHSRVLAHQQRLNDAVAWLVKSCPQFTADTTCSTYLVDMAARTKDLAALDEAAATHLALACTSAEACANAATWIGNLYMAHGSYDRALGRFERAANEYPSASAWNRVAEAAFASGHVSRAQSALIAARRLGAPADSELEHRIEQARRTQLLNDALRH